MKDFIAKPELSSAMLFSQTIANTLSSWHSHNVSDNFNARLQIGSTTKNRRLARTSWMHGSPSQLFLTLETCCWWRIELSTANHFAATRPACRILPHW